MAKPADEKDLVQAVVIADSFNSRFAPISSHYPRALLRLGNAPLIDYALKALADAGVHECIVYCRSHADKVEEWVKQSPQSTRFPSAPIVRKCPTMRSLGDAMRDLDQSRLIKNDFLLLPADLVTNADLADLLVEHKRRRLKDANCLMTLVMRSTAGGPDISGLMRAQERCGVAVTNAATGCLRCIAYPGTREAHVRLDGAALRSSMHSRLWTGLVDCGLAVCSVHVPPRFSDEFDYRSLDDLVRGVLVNEEILGHTVTLCVLGSREYACRVSNMHLYAVVTQHLLDNWIFPITPACMSGSFSDYQKRPRNVYVSRSATVDRSVRLIKSVLIDAGARVDAHCTLSNCVVGPDCRVGKNCQLSDCYLWRGVEVGDDCIIQQSLLCDGCQVMMSSCLTDRCVLAPKVRVEESTMLVDRRLPEVKRTGEICTKSSATVTNAFVTGKSTDAGDDEDSSDDVSEGLDAVEDTTDAGAPYNRAIFPDEEDFAEIWRIPEKAFSSEQGRVGQSDGESSSSEDDAKEVPLPAVGEEHFARELLDVLLRAEKEGQSTDTMIVEINSIKHAFCVHIDRLKSILVHTIMLYPLLRREQSTVTASAATVSTVEYVKEALDRLRAWRPLIDNYFNDAESQLLFLRSFEDACCEHPEPLIKGGAIRLLKSFYDTDLCDEPAILRWYAEEGAHPRAREVRDSVAKLIQWLQEASEESDESD